MTICRVCGLYYPASKSVFTCYREPVCSPACRRDVYERVKTMGGLPKDVLDARKNEKVRK